MSEALAKAEGAFSETAIDDEIVLMNLATGDFFSLEGTSRAIWLLIDGARSRSDIIAALAGVYSAEPDAIAADLDAFVGELRGAGLLVPA